jgi:alkylation response protein AidB-like acyl-CoA dehydrogenase
MEPRFAFDINSLATTATQQNGDFMGTGTKRLVPLAADAQHMVIYSQGQDGIAAFIAFHGIPGLFVAEREQNMGLKGLATYTVKLDECGFAATHRLNGDLQALLNRSRIAPWPPLPPVSQKRHSSTPATTPKSAKRSARAFPGSKPLRLC